MVRVKRTGFGFKWELPPPAAFYQFERHGYFCVDARDSTPAHLVFNRSVGLRGTWARIEKAGGG